MLQRVIQDVGAITEQVHPTAGPVRQVTSPWTLYGSPEARVDFSPAPGRGEHTEEVLVESGLDASQVHELIEAGVVWAP